jgi:diacylglycerol kinase family enzyme
LRYHLLENPSAGRRRGSPFVARFADALRARGHEVVVYVGEKPGDLARHAAGLDAAACDALLVAGGDGTLRSVLNGSDALPPWPIGMIPIGTANLVARETHMLTRRTPEALADGLERAERWRVDLLEVRRAGARPERAISSVGVGLDGALVSAVAELRGADEASGGYAKWVTPLLGVLGRFAFDDLDLRVDDGRRVASPLAVAQNARHYGGLFLLAPEARLDSGWLDLVTVRARTRRDLVRLALRAGLGRFHRDRQVAVVRCRGVRVVARAPVPVQADGDPAGTTDLEVRLLPGALALLRVP